MAAVINSTVHISKEQDGEPVVVYVGTELSGDYSWVPDVLKKHGTYDLLTEKPTEDAKDIEGPTVGEVETDEDKPVKGHKGSK